MADFPAVLLPQARILSAMPEPKGAVLLRPPGPGTTQTVKYVMQWLDTDCGSPGTPKRWIAPVPDPTGIYYTSGGGPAKCGPTPITGGVIADVIRSNT